jgi:Transposase IS116/IS110/IS902 family
MSEIEAKPFVRYCDAHQVGRELLAESKQHPATKLLRQIPVIGPIRAAVLIALKTPHRFRSKRPLWKYRGFGIEMHSSADYREVQGQLQRSRKQVSVRGLNRDCNHDLKNLFKSAATIASVKPGPFQEFYAALLARDEAGSGAPDPGQKDRHDCVDRMEERSELRRPISETTNSLSVSDRVRGVRCSITHSCATSPTPILNHVHKSG